jgi:hypothetical protein
MRIVIPLYDFSYSGKGYKFRNGTFSIKRMKKCYLNGLPLLFSRLDIMRIKEAHWCLLVSDDSITLRNRAKHNANSEMLILTFKIFINAGLFVKYRICPEDAYLNSRLSQPMMYEHRLAGNKTPQGIVVKTARKLFLHDRDISVVDKYYPSLLEMWDFSNRTRNALLYTLSGFRSKFWQESFLFYMIALEALFSSDDNTGMTKTICSRVSRYLGSIQHCTYEDINCLYNLRSQIVHGKIRIEGAGGWDENIKATANAEYLLVCSIRKLVESGDFKRYSNSSEMQHYLSHLN